MKHVPRSILSSKRYIDSKQDNTELFFCGQIPENGVKTFHQLYSFNIKVNEIQFQLTFCSILFQILF